MSHDNQFLKDVQDKLSTQVENQKQLWATEQAKAKAFFEDLKQESVNNFEQAKNHIQKHIEEVNTLTKNLHTHFQEQPFDVKSFSKVFTDYHSKQLELISESARVQAQKLSEFQNKLVSFYHEKQNDIKKEVEKAVETTQELVKTPVKKPVVKKAPAKKTVAKKTTTK